MTKYDASPAGHGKTPRRQFGKIYDQRKIGNNYASFVSSDLAVDWPDLSHERLGCALLQGPADVETFQAIRVGAMVLSDLGCRPAHVADAAAAFGVVARVAHIAQVALAADDQPDYWRALLAALPSVDLDEGEGEFLPGLSRFSLETGTRGPGLGSARSWLRTAHVQA